MKAKFIAAIIIIACSAYGVASWSAAEATTTTVQKSLDRMSAVEAALK